LPILWQALPAAQELLPTYLNERTTNDCDWQSSSYGYFTTYAKEKTGCLPERKHPFRQVL